MSISTTCQVVFEADRSKPYSYLCGALTVKQGDFVVVLVGGEAKRKKIVEVVMVDNEELAHKATTPIWGLVVEQSTAPPIASAQGQ